LADSLPDDKILDYVKNLETVHDDQQTIDITWLEDFAVKLKEEFDNNKKLRLKYSNDPMKFIDSEFKLNSLIKELTNITQADPPIYKEFVEIAGDTLSGLNEHPNDQIWESLRYLYNDVFDFSDEDDLEGKEHLIIYLIHDNSLLNALVSRIIYEPNEKFEELEVIDSILDCDNEELNQSILQNERFMSVLLNLINKFKGSNFNNQDLAVDILSKVIQVDSKTFVINYPTTVETLLVQLARLKDLSPKRDDSPELIYAEVVTLALKQLLQSGAGVSLFLENEGFELLSIILKNSKNSFGINTFVKLLNSVLEYDIDDVRVKVSIGTIKTNAFLSKFFKYFPDEKDQDQLDKFLKFLGKLISLLPYDSDERLRLVNKLLSNDYKYLKRLNALSDHYSNLINDDFSFTEEEAENGASYETRLRNGLSIVQTICTIKAWLIQEDSSIESSLVDNGLVDIKQVILVLEGHLQELEKSYELTENDYFKHEVETQLDSTKELLTSLQLKR
jgi:beta-catenin-like protein 1